MPSSGGSRAASTRGWPPPRRSQARPTGCGRPWPGWRRPEEPCHEAVVRRRDTSLSERLTALRTALELAEGRLEVPEIGQARALLAKAGARAALGDATVVALAGATGS